MKRAWPFVVPICFLLTIICPVCESQERIDIEEWFRQAKMLLEKTESYTAVFHKQERIKGTLKTRETVLLKFKKPFKVYMKWIDGPGKGREVYYVPGWNDNRILVREPALRGTVTLNLHPQSPLAMQGSRHPITEVGLDRMIKLFGDNLQRVWGSAEFELRRGQEEMLFERWVLPVEIVFPRDRQNGYYCYRSIISFDLEKKIPIRVRNFDWEDRLIEDYGYEALRLHAGLTDADFDPTLPRAGIKR
jgi:outer membrane lipoprotein-sorting protein